MEESSGRTLIAALALAFAESVKTRFGGGRRRGGGREALRDPLGSG